MRLPLSLTALACATMLFVGCTDTSTGPDPDPVAKASVTGNLTIVGNQGTASGQITNIGSSTIQAGYGVEIILKRKGTGATLSPTFTARPGQSIAPGAKVTWTKTINPGSDWTLADVDAAATVYQFDSGVNARRVRLALR